MLQVLEAGERPALDYGDRIRRQVDRLQMCGPLQHHIVHNLDPIVGDVELAQYWTMHQRLGRQRGKLVVRQIDLDQVGEHGERARVDLRQPTVDQVQALQIAQLGLLEDVRLERAQWITGQVEHLGAGVQAARYVAELGGQALDPDLARAPLARTSVVALCLCQLGRAPPVVDIMLKEIGWRTL